MRRPFFLPAFLFAVLPAVFAPGAAASIPAPAAPFVPPEGPCVLIRTVSRDLPDGKRIVASRRYEVRFLRQDGGFRVEGRLLAVSVEAPAALSALTAIERGRSDEGLFPLNLDPRGRIVSSTSPVSRVAAAQAAAASRRAIARSGLDETARSQAEGFIGQVAAGGAGGSQWPDDLFNPVTGTRHTTDRLVLPGGAAATVSTTIAAEHGTAGSAIERIVVTATGADRRTTRETYRLVFAPR